MHKYFFRNNNELKKRAKKNKKNAKKELTMGNRWNIDSGTGAVRAELVVIRKE